MTRYDTVTAAELRLIDMLLASGTMEVTPHSVPVEFPPGTAAPIGPWFPQLRRWVPELQALARPAGGRLQHGSMTELLAICERALQGAQPEASAQR